jgi:ribosomal protein S16
MYNLLLQNLPFYKLVVAPQRAPRDGKHLEVLGWYNPQPCEWCTPAGCWFSYNDIKGPKSNSRLRALAAAGNTLCLAHDSQ